MELNPNNMHSIIDLESRSPIGYSGEKREAVLPSPSHRQLVDSEQCSKSTTCEEKYPNVSMHNDDLHVDTPCGVGFLPRQLVEVCLRSGRQQNHPP